SVQSTLQIKRCGDRPKHWAKHRSRKRVLSDIQPERRPLKFAVAKRRGRMEGDQFDIHPDIWLVRRPRELRYDLVRIYETQTLFIFLNSENTKLLVGYRCRGLLCAVLQQRHAVVAKILQNLSRLLAKGFHARPRLKSNSAASGSCGSRQMQPTTSPLVIEQCRLPSDKARRASRLVLTIARSHKFCVPTGRLK